MQSNISYKTLNVSDRDFAIFPFLLFCLTTFVKFKHSHPCNPLNACKQAFLQLISQQLASYHFRNDILKLVILFLTVYLFISTGHFIIR